MRAALAVAAALSVVAVPARAACSARDIELKRWTMDRDAGWFTISGELVNRCSEPTGVQLQVILRDATGQIVSSEDLWADAQRNYAPGAHTFTIRTRGYATAKSADVRVLSTQRWPGR